MTGDLGEPILGENIPRHNTEAVQNLDNRLETFRHQDATNFAWLDFEYDLKEINGNARLVSDSERADVRPTLKRVLLCSTPWSRNSRYITEHMTDLVYSPQELVSIKEERERSQRQAEEIEREIAVGKDPWLAHVEHNEKSIFGPYMVGFYQDGNGKIKIIYGPKYFKSKRQIENTIFGGRTPYKEVNLVTGEFQPVQSPRIFKGKGWDQLPDDLRQHFEAGEILITGNQDLYRLSDEDVEKLAHLDDPSALSAEVDERVGIAAKEDSKYFLLYYSDYDGDDTGRTGVVMHTDGGEIKPVVISQDGAEFVVEVKGCGRKSGGFGKMQHRTGRDILTGGAEAEQAETEFYRLQDDKRGDSPKPIGSILFSNPEHKDQEGREYQQGYVIRLTPSTIRAAYTGIEAYPDIEKPEMVKRILDMYTSQLISHIFSNPQKILDRSSHTENMLIWGNGEFAWTDYSDHISFDDDNFPHYDNHGGYMTPKQMLEIYIRMVDEIPGYKSGSDKAKFYADLTDAFRDRGENLGLEISDDHKVVAQKIWENGMAYQVFRGRKSGNYIAEGVIREYDEDVNKDYLGKKLSLDSEGSFIDRIAQGRDDMLKAIDLFESKMPGKLSVDTLTRWRQLLKDAPLSEVLELQGEFQTSTYHDLDTFTFEERGIIYGAAAYFRDFDYVLLRKFRNYFEHELDVVVTAKAGNNPYAHKELEQAEDEINGKVQGITHLLDADLSGLYRLLTDPAQVRSLVGMSFYGH